MSLGGISPRPNWSSQVHYQKRVSGPTFLSRKQIHKYRDILRTNQDYVMRMSALVKLAAVKDLKGLKIALSDPNIYVRRTMIDFFMRLNYTEGLKLALSNSTESLQRPILEYFIKQKDIEGVRLVFEEGAKIFLKEPDSTICLDAMNAMRELNDTKGLCDTLDNEHTFEVLYHRVKEKLEEFKLMGIAILVQTIDSLRYHELLLNENLL